MNKLKCKEMSFSAIITHQNTFSFFWIWILHCWKFWIRIKLQYKIILWI